MANHEADAAAFIAGLTDTEVRRIRVLAQEDRAGFAAALKAAGVTKLGVRLKVELLLQAAHENVSMPEEPAAAKNEEITAAAKGEEITATEIEQPQPATQIEELCFDLSELELAAQLALLRFVRFDRVVCKIGGPRLWASGTIQEIDVVNPENPENPERLPYRVKIDNGPLVHIGDDVDSLIRAEVCFGQRADALLFTACCLPARQARTRRFRAGERVACAVEDGAEPPAGTRWAAGTVLDVDVDCSADAADASEGSIGGEAEDTSHDATTEGTERPAGARPQKRGSAALVPYRVQLDSGSQLLVHRDEHWLERDLALQPEGPRQQPGGKRCLARIERRRRGDAWEAVDHATRNTRSTATPDSSGDESAC